MGVVGDDKGRLAAELARLTERPVTFGVADAIHAYFIACRAAGRRRSKLRDLWEQEHGRKLPTKWESFHAIAVELGLVDESLEVASLERSLRRARLALKS